MVEEHTIKRTLVEITDDPAHDERTETEEFESNRKKLISMGITCFSCGSKEKLEAHHIVEWAYFNKISKRKMKKLLRVFDPYGYSQKLIKTTIKDPDDIRNLIILCKKCHRLKYTGIHEVSFPAWVAQACARDQEIILKK